MQTDDDLEFSEEVAKYIESDPRLQTVEEQARWEERRRQFREWLATERRDAR